MIQPSIFATRAAALLLLALLPLAALGHNQVHLRFDTGGDDLRGGKINGTGNNIDLVFLTDSGDVFTLRNANQSATWGAGSSNEVVIDDIPQLERLARVQISLTDRQKNDPFEHADNWGDYFFFGGPGRSEACK